MSHITPNELNSRLDDQGDFLLLDVREPVEHMQERIPGSQLMPLERLDLDNLPRDVTICVHCRTGRRAAVAAGKLADAGFNVLNLEGGIEHWKQHGLDIHKTPGAPKFTITQQVMMTGGLLALLGIAIGFTVSPVGFGLAAFIAAGQVFAGATGWCGMGMLIAKMPWNRMPEACGAE
ncbi:MAG: rhodanese-like domain-containing protein [Planctomycetota bacterium]|jgi:rhodanese-related sulfurtransferase